MNNKQCVAGIVTYNPNLIRLKENIIAILPQVDSLLINDNGSANIESISNLLSNYSKVILIKNKSNLGIATALNILCENALKLGATWLLTLDQDSIVSHNLMANYERWRKRLNNEKIASLTCDMKDISGTKVLDGSEDGYIDFCITSGNYIRLKTWQLIGRFDDKLFIDKVDTDYCYRLVQKGFFIYKIPYCGLHHEIGKNVSEHKLFTKTFFVFNHSPFRCYYIIRNQIYFARKYSKSLTRKERFRIERTAWTRILIYWIFESQKFRKTKAWIKGIYDGYTM